MGKERKTKKEMRRREARIEYTALTSEFLFNYPEAEGQFTPLFYQEVMDIFEERNIAVGKDFTVRGAIVKALKKQGQLSLAKQFALETKYRHKDPTNNYLVSAMKDGFFVRCCGGIYSTLGGYKRHLSQSYKHIAQGDQQSCLLNYRRALSNYLSKT